MDGVMLALWDEGSRVTRHSAAVFDAMRQHLHDLAMSISILEMTFSLWPSAS